MRRRNFVGLLAAAFTAPEILAQPAASRKRLALLFGNGNDANNRAVVTTLKDILSARGWREGVNLAAEVRWGNGDADLIDHDAAELLTLAPDVIFALGIRATRALAAITSTTPIVFGGVADVSLAGLVASISRPEKNLTGFLIAQDAVYSKSASLLLALAPKLRSIAMLTSVSNPSNPANYKIISAAARELGLESVQIGVGQPDQIDGAIGSLRGKSVGMIVPADAFFNTHRQSIIAATAQNRIPAIYNQELFVRSGGLIAYGSARDSMWRGAAEYVDRLFRGEAVRDLPIQAPSSYRLSINQKAARELGLEVPANLLALADEVIE